MIASGSQVLRGGYYLQEYGERQHGGGRVALCGGGGRHPGRGWRGRGRGRGPRGGQEEDCQDEGAEGVHHSRYTPSYNMSGISMPKCSTLRHLSSELNFLFLIHNQLYSKSWSKYRGEMLGCLCHIQYFPGTLGHLILQVIGFVRILKKICIFLSWRFQENKYKTQSFGTKKGQRLQKIYLVFSASFITLTLWLWIFLVYDKYFMCNKEKGYDKKLKMKYTFATPFVISSFWIFLVPGLDP